MSLTQFQRLDKFLEEKGLAPTRERAAELIKAGKVTVNGVVITAPNCPVTAGQKITISQLDTPYITPDAVKLDSALKHYKIDVKGRICIDLGAGKGGFTDVLLQHKAKHVVSVDSQQNMLHPSLRLHERVTNLDRLTIDKLNLPHLPLGFDVVVCDIDTPLKPALQHVIPLCPAGTDFIMCLKPETEFSDDALLKKYATREIEMWLKMDMKCHVSRAIPAPQHEGMNAAEFMIHARLLNV